jgi:hypothetical protein
LLGFIFIAFIRSQDSEEDISPEDIAKSAKLEAVDPEAPLLSSGPSGLHKDKSLYYALGWTLVLEGIFSALYHVMFSFSKCNRFKGLSIKNQLPVW